MKTVSTVVATATFIGISSIGLSLAQPYIHENTNITTGRKRKQSSLQTATIDPASKVGGVDSVGMRRVLGENWSTDTDTTKFTGWKPQHHNHNHKDLDLEHLHNSSETAYSTTTSSHPHSHRLSVSTVTSHQRDDTGSSVSSPSFAPLVTMTTNIHPSLRPSHAFSPIPTSQPHSRLSPLPPSTSSSFHSQPRQSYDGRVFSGKVRRLTLSLEDTASTRRHEYERDGSSPVGTPEDIEPPYRLRPRTSSSTNSWMKRFSSAMSSRSASPAPSVAISAAPSFSTASKTFSHHSSNAPMLGSRPPTAPVGPNKLVKRTSSHRIASDSLVPTTSRFALTRPATSHQRTAALQHSSSLRDSADSVGSSVDCQPSNQVKWRQYFSIKVPKFARNQKRHATHDGITNGRIYPHGSGNPTLVSTQTNMAPLTDVEDVVMLDNEQENSDRPQSTMDRDTQSGHGNHPSPNPDFLASSGRESVDFISGGRFSIQGLLRRRSSRAEEHRRPSKLVKRTSRRVFSDPLILSNVKSEASDDERPVKRQQPANNNGNGTVLDAQRTTRQEVDMNFIALSSAYTASPTTFNSGRSSPYATSATNSPDLTQYQFQGKSNQTKPMQASKSQSVSRLQMRTSTVSATASEPTSTLVGSEVETSRGASSILVDDEDTDQSTLFDSLKTRGTRSTSGAQRGRIETIFDESPSPPRSSSPRLRDILPDGMLHGQELRRKEMDDESVMATPVRTIRSIRSDRADDGSPLAPRTKSRSNPPLPMSSPPSMQKALSLGTLEYDDQAEEEDDESRWSCFEEESKLSLTEEVDMPEDQSIADMDWTNSKRTSVNSITTTSTSRGSEGKDNRKDTKSNLFDWSEQPGEKSLTNQTPPRPRTVHGSKKSVAGRGSRATGRRIPSGLHARSQSVPVVPGLTGKRETVMTNKFGTWGVGSKGVSEDWDEDFDFDEDGHQPGATAGNRDEKRIDSGTVMHIPQTIRESQVAVVNNIGLVREFYKLIEELKVLRLRATHDGQIQSPIPAVWNEIDAMIDLADQEVDDPLFPAQSSLPASPAHEPDPFDDCSETVRRPSFPNVTADPRRSRSQRRTVLPNAENDIFSTPVSKTMQVLEPSPATSIKTRPRKDSEAMARSVIEAVQRKKELSSSDLSLQPVASNKKVPFDTNTLRHIVPYVNNLVRKIRASMKDQESLNESNHASTINEQTRLSQLFNQPPSNSPTHKKSKRPDFKIANVSRGKENQDEDISKQLNDMSLI